MLLLSEWVFSCEAGGHEGNAWRVYGVNGNVVAQVSEGSGEFSSWPQLFEKVCETIHIHSIQPQTQLSTVFIHTEET